MKMFPPLKLCYCDNRMLPGRHGNDPWLEIFHILHHVLVAADRKFSLFCETFWLREAVLWLTSILCSWHVFWKSCTFDKNFFSNDLKIWIFFPGVWSLQRFFSFLNEAILEIPFCHLLFSFDTSHTACLLPFRMDSSQKIPILSCSKLNFSPAQNIVNYTSWFRSLFLFVLGHVYFLWKIFDIVKF